MDRIIFRWFPLCLLALFLCFFTQSKAQAVSSSLPPAVAQEEASQTLLKDTITPCDRAVSPSIPVLVPPSKPKFTNTHQTFFSLFSVCINCFKTPFPAFLTKERKLCDLGCKASRYHSCLSRRARLR